MIAILLSPIYILVNLYVLRWMFRWMAACHKIFEHLIFRILFSGVYILLATSLLSSFLIKKPEHLHRILKETSNYFIGTFIYIILVIAVVDLGRIIIRRTHLISEAVLSSRKTFVITGLICITLISTLSIHGIIHAKHVYTTTYNVSVDKSVDGSKELKIALIADLHLGYSIADEQMSRMVKKVNAMNPDIVLIAGDIFDNDYDAINKPEKTIDVLKTIKSKYGVYTCWGNHDISEPILAGFTFPKKGEALKEDPRMREFLSSANIQLLEDESTLINNEFYIVGRKDPSMSKKEGTSRLSPSELTADLDTTKPVIFLDHEPKELQEIADAGADLDLCGHTHNGQMFPGNLTIHLFWENPCGLITKDKMTNIVTSGVGIWGPDMRVGTKSEVVEINVSFK